jgi:serine/threonine protein kinase
LINKPRNNRETIKMIRNEQDICQFLQSARCDGIVEIFEINETKDSVYIIEELIKNGNLKDYLLLNRLTEKEKVIIIKQLATTIQFLHKNGIVHRDLKLENVLIDTTQTNGVWSIQTKVIDFGLSTFFLGNPNMKDKYGTLLYLPPEIVLSHTYTKKLDIWDFGLIAFTILNDGEHPFGKETEVQTLLQKIIHRDVDYQHIDKKFHAMLNACLQKESQRKDIDEIITMIDELGIV